MDEWTRKAAETFSGDLFAVQVTGIVLEQAGENYARCTLALESRHRNANHQVMGGVIFTLADFAFAVAANGSGLQTPTVTLASQIQYLSPVRGERLTAETNCLKNGRSTCVFEVLVTDELGTKIAKATVTGYRVRK